MPGPIMCDLKGLTLLPDEADWLRHPNVGGVILFARNYQDPEQLKALTSAIRQMNASLLLAVDHEGGRVQRFVKGFTRLPNMGSLGILYHRKPAEALKLAEQVGFVMAAELSSFDFDISFAPVLDLNYGCSQVIGNRSFDASPQVVTKLASALMLGMKLGGLSCVGKHFPGHGYVEVDSHLDLPIDRRSLAEMEEMDLLPFSNLNTQLDAIMPAHVAYTEIDQNPATFSERWLQGILREKCGFKGAILSDALDMKGVANMADLPTRAKWALEAGCDMILSCNDPSGTHNLIHSLSADLRKAKSSARLQKLRNRYAYTGLPPLMASAFYHEARVAVEKWTQMLDQGPILANDTVAQSGRV